MTDLVKLMEDIFGIPPRPTPKTSVIANILPTSSEPAILLYGPSKSGKTRLIIHEAAAHAAAMNRKLLAIYSEPNMEPHDFATIVSACAYHNVYCELLKLDRIDAIRKIINKVTSFLTDKRRKKIKLEEFDLPSVFIIDSLTSLSELITAQLSEAMLENPQGLLAYHNPYQIAIIDPLRRLVATSQAMLFTVAHETQTRGEAYNPNVPKIKAKPRYVSSAKYKEDAEVYMTDTPPSNNLTTCEKLKEAKKKYAIRYLVTVRSRRCLECEGKGIAVALVPKSGVVRAQIEYSFEPGYVIVRFAPEDMATDKSKVREYPYTALVPEIVCGPKQI